MDSTKHSLIKLKWTSYNSIEDNVPPPSSLTKSEEEFHFTNDSTRTNNAIHPCICTSVRLPMASQHNQEGSVTITNEEIISTKYDTMTIRRIVMRYVSTRIVLYTILWHRTRAVIEFHDCLK